MCKIFQTLNIFVIYLVIPSCTNTGATKTLSSRELVEKELSPIEENLKMIMDPETSNDKKLELKGVVRGSLSKIIERAIKAEQQVNRLNVEKGGSVSEKNTIRLLEQRIQRVTIPLSVRNKATKIENKHPEIEGTIPKEMVKRLKSFEKPIIKRQYKWMELLNCIDDLYIKKLEADLKIAFSKITSDTEHSYEQFKLNFCYALATVIENVNKNIEHYAFEGMEQDLDLFTSDSVIYPYIAVFYNSIVARGKQIVSIRAY